MVIFGGVTGGLAFVGSLQPRPPVAQYPCRSVCRDRIRALVSRSRAPPAPPPRHACRPTQMPMAPAESLERVDPAPAAHPPGSAPAGCAWLGAGCSPPSSPSGRRARGRRAACPSGPGRTGRPAGWTPECRDTGQSAEGEGWEPKRWGVMGGEGKGGNGTQTPYPTPPHPWALRDPQS